MPRSHIRAQGTIEYLVIIALVIIIALVLTTLLLATTNDPIQGVNSNSNQLRGLTQGTITVIDSIIDEEGDGVILLQDLGNKLKSIEKVSLTSDSSKTFEFVSQKINGLWYVYIKDTNAFCVCENAGTHIACNLSITSTNTNNINKIVQVTSALCTTDTNTPFDIVTPPVLDNSPPVLYLQAPVNTITTSSRTIDFNFNVTDTSSLSRCELFINGKSDTNKTTGLVNGNNIIQKTFPLDVRIDWNVSCYDSSLNKGNSNTYSLDVNQSPYQITSCTELQQIENNLSGKYTLMNDIDCSATLVNFDDGSNGFTPISAFSGTLDGNKHTISQLATIGTENSGLFSSLIEGAMVKQLVLQSETVISRGAHTAGGLAGSLVFNDPDKNITIEEVFTSGSITGDTNVGGLIGTIDCRNSDCQVFLRNLYTTTSITGINSGGIIGTITSDYPHYLTGSIENIYFNGYLFGEDFRKSGGLIGSALLFRSTLNNSFAIGTISSGGGIMGDALEDYLVNIYWDMQVTMAENCVSTDQPPYYGCTFTFDDPGAYKGASGLPFSTLNWSTDIWKSQENNYPIFQWQ